MIFILFCYFECETQEAQSFARRFCLGEGILCFCQDILPLCFHLFLWNSPSGWMHSFLLAGDGRGQCVKWQSFTLPLPYSAIYVDSEHTYDGCREDPECHRNWWCLPGMKEVTLPLCLVPQRILFSGIMPLPRVLVGWGARLCLLCKEREGAKEKKGAALLQVT